MSAVNPSNVFMNWKQIVIVAGSLTINMAEVTSLAVLDEDQLEMWQADGNKFATVVVAASGTRGVTISGGDIFRLSTIPSGVACTITAKLYDSINGAGPGCLNLTLVNAVRGATPAGGESNKFATGSVTFMAYSPDGNTDPLTITQVPATS